MAGWWPVVRAEEIGQAPRRVEVAGRAYTAFRPRPDAAVAVVAARCPHRLVRLDHGRVVDGRLRCAYHGWEFDGAGSCMLVPSAGPQGSVPPRAHLGRPWGVREAEGLVWVAPVDPATVPVDQPGWAPPPEDDERATSQVFTNLDPALEHAWHPVALVSEVPADGRQRAVRLLGRDATVRRQGGHVAVDPPMAAVCERFGVVWVAPSPPVVGLFEALDDVDPGFAQGWLVPERSASGAAVLAENFLDVAHFPFVHAGTFGAAEEPYVPPFDVEVDEYGLRSVQEQWFDNPEDPGVHRGERPVRQRRRATYVYRAPFQLQLRLEELDAGAVKTILFFLQPEDLYSTRVYTKMLLHGIGGVAVPDADVVAAEVAFEVAVLAEDLRLQEAMTVPGLPLRLRDELHVRSDRSGVALRRILRRLSGLDPADVDPE